MEKHKENEMSWWDDYSNGTGLYADPEFMLLMASMEAAEWLRWGEAHDARTVW